MKTQLNLTILAKKSENFTRISVEILEVLDAIIVETKSPLITEKQITTIPNFRRNFSILYLAMNIIEVKKKQKRTFDVQFPILGII